MQDVKPLKNNDLIAVWVSKNDDLQLSIDDTKGRGKYIKYTDIHTEGHRYLKVESSIINETYEINSIDEHSMCLTDHANKQYTLMKYPLRVNNS